MLLDFTNIGKTKKNLLLLCISILFHFCSLSAEENSNDLTEKKPNIQENLKDITGDPEVYIDEDEFADLPPVTWDVDNELDNNDKEGQPDYQQTEKQHVFKPEEKEKAEKLLKQIMTGFEKISFSLEHIALVLSNNQLRIKDKSPLVDEVMKLRAFTHMIVASAVTETSPQKIAHLLSLQKQLIDHLRYILTTDLISFVPFDKVMPTKRSLGNTDQQDQSISELEASLKQNENILAKLESESISVGLNSFNILFRRLEKLNDDYKIVNKCLWGLGGIAALGGILFVLDKRYIKKIGHLFDGTLSWLGLQSSSEQVQGDKIEKEPVVDSNPVNYPIPTTTRIPQQHGSNSYGFDLQQQLQAIYGNSSARNYSSQEPSVEIVEDIESTGPVTDFLISTKDIIGDAIPAIGKMTPQAMPSYGKIVGEGTWAQDLLYRNLGLVILGIPPISIFGILQPHLKDAATHSLEWIQTKQAQLASFLRGGPAKKALSKFERESKHTFDDVIGNEHAKMVFSRILEYFLDPEKFDRGGMAPTNAKLLFGKTRTGKSFFIDAFYGEVRRKFEERGLKNNLLYLSMSVAQLKEYGITNVLMYAQYHAPCLLFIDEIDKGRFQNDGDAHSLSELQVAMSNLNIDISKKVIIVAATNNPQHINASILADGRFGEPIPFVLPQVHEITEYLNRELAKRAAIIDPDYIQQLAFEAEGANYDGLKAILMTAFQKAKIKGITLTPDELNEALDEQHHKIIFDEKSLPEKELLLVAVHQVGHALMRTLLSPSLQLTKITIRPVCQKIEEVSVLSESLSGDKKVQPTMLDYGAIFTAHKEDAYKFETFKDLVSELKICLAGHCAEKVLFGGTSYSYHEQDSQKAFDLAKRIVFNGMQEKNLPKALKEQKLAEAYELMQKYEIEVIELLTSYKKEVITLANILFEEKTLSAETFQAILHEIERRKNAQENSDDTENTEVSADVNDFDEPIEIQQDASDEQDDENESK